MSKKKHRKQQIRGESDDMDLTQSDISGEVVKLNTTPTAAGAVSTAAGAVSTPAASSDEDDSDSSTMVTTETETETETESLALPKRTADLPMGNAELNAGLKVNNTLTRLRYQSSRFPQKTATMVRPPPPTGLTVAVIVLLTCSMFLSLAAAGVWLWMASLDNSLVRGWVLGMLFFFLALVLLGVLCYLIYQRHKSPATVNNSV